MGACVPCPEDRSELRVPLAEMQPIPVHARNPGPLTGAGNWTWLIRGRCTTLIDAGAGHPQHLDELQALLGAAPLDQVLVTHAHPDHAAGAPALADRFPGVRFAKMPWPERDGTWAVGWEPLGPDATVEAGDGVLQVVHTPGHAPDHVCFLDAGTRVLFGGDLVIAGASVWIPSGPDGDLAAYLGSLERTLALQPSRIYPAHGAIIDDPAAVLHQSLAHRHAREAQVLDSLRLGAGDASAIVSRIHDDLPERLRALARESVSAHLLKLEREGRVRRIGDAWHIMSP